MKVRALLQTVSAILIAAPLIGTAAQAEPAEAAKAAEAKRAAEAHSLVKGFAGRLKQTLMGAVEAGGPVEAIAVCQIAAPAIAKDEAQKTGWSVGRTALRLRNPQNAPDAWERAVLLNFQDRLEQGADIKTLEHYETTTQDGQKIFRYMKAIPMQAPCLACHGSTVSAAVSSKIAELYPDDQATGFSVGELRGAFTVVQPLE